MTQRHYLLLFIFLGFVGATASLFGQAGGSELTGKVLDQAGSAVVQARVTVTDEDTGLAKQVLTTRSGDYSFPSLRPGIYRVDVSVPGFKTLQRKGVGLETGRHILLDLVLQLGSNAETIVVSAGQMTLQSAASDVETVVHGDAVPAMPLNGRNFVQLATFSPGVALPQGTQLPRINGGRPRTNEYLFDGISALQPEPGQVAFFPIVDDIQEFNIETNGVPAEFGRFNGGVLNLTTKGGTNAFHGSLYNFFRNEDLNARNYFTPTTARKPRFRRNQYGGTTGGPIAQRDRQLSIGPGRQLSD